LLLGNSPASTTSPPSPPRRRPTTPSTPEPWASASSRKPSTRTTPAPTTSSTPTASPPPAPTSPSSTGPCPPTAAPPTASPAPAHVATTAPGGPAAQLHLAGAPDAPPPTRRAGRVPHAAFPPPTFAAYDPCVHRLAEIRLPTTGPVRRFYSKGLYLPDPNGIL